MFTQAGMPGRAGFPICPANDIVESTGSIRNYRTWSRCFCDEGEKYLSEHFRLHDPAA